MDAVTLRQAKNYADKLVQGLGSIKGANCTIKSATEKDDGVELVFEWVGNSGAKETTTVFVKNGEQGNGIVKVEKIKSVDLVDTYRMTFTDGSTFEYEVTNGDSSLGGASTWSEVKDKPFETIGADFTVVNDELKLADGVGGKIDAVKVNGVEVPVVDKAVDIEIPKDLVVTSGEVIVVDDGHPVSGLTNGTYLKLTIANQTEPVYINVADLCDVYTGKTVTDGVSIAVSDTNEISATLVGKAVSQDNLDDTLSQKIDYAVDSYTWNSIA